MHRAEGVGHIHVRQSGQLPGELGIVLLFPGIKAGVLQQQDLAGLQGGGLGLGVGADGVLGEDHGTAQKLGKPLGHGSQRQIDLGVRVLFGLAQMGADHQRRTVVQQILDRGQGRTDALVIGDLMCRFVQRYVEVYTQQDFFALEAGVTNAFFLVVHVYTLLKVEFQLCILLHSAVFFKSKTGESPAKCPKMPFFHRQKVIPRFWLSDPPERQVALAKQGMP